MKHTPLFNTLIVIVCVTCLPVQVFTQCEQQYDWTSWNSFTPMLASGTIMTGGQQIGVSMSANFSFSSTGNIYGYGAFNSFNGSLPPNATVPLTTWSFGPGGTTTMCFSTTVTNPVLLASIGRPGVPVTLQFSRAYVPVFNGQQVTYLNDTTLIGEEGYTIIMFPGNFDCVTIFSTTPEYYTNITWGLNPPLFEVNIEGDTVGCASVTLTASGGQAYAWSGGDNPSSAVNTFHDSGTYFLTVTDEEGCTVITSATVALLSSVSDTIVQSICAGDSYEGYAVSGTYTDVFTFPSGCDSVRVLMLTVLPAVETTLSATICSGSVFEGYTASGEYRDTLLSASGCDSVRVLMLTVLPAVETTLSATICSGGSVEGYTASGVYRDTLLSANGCDSVRVLTLTVLPAVETTLSATICSGGSFEGYTASGVYWDTLLSANGCDSVRVLTLTVLPAVETTLSATICSGSVFEGYTASGVYWDTLLSANGCDSVRVLTLTVLPAVETTLSATICSGGSFEGYTASGEYRDTLLSANGCDSVRVLTLTVQGIQITRQNLTLCNGASYNFYGRVITASGVYADTLPTVYGGCDSIISIFVTVVEQPEFLGPDTVLCAETTFVLASHTDQTFWPDGSVGATYRVNQTGEYWATLRDERGCVFTDTVYITLGPAVYIPNAFSPNQDGINDCFRAYVAHPEAVNAFRLSIFDRWGNQVFMTTNQDDCWDGTRAGEPFSADVYVYYLELNTEGCGLVLKKGDVVLVR